jgi:hypothetical protein
MMHKHKAMACIKNDENMVMANNKIQLIIKRLKIKKLPNNPNNNGIIIENQNEITV